MDVQLSSEQAAQLARIASVSGRKVDELAREAVDRYLAEEARFQTAVQAGIDSADRGELVSSEDVWVRLEKKMQS